MAYEPIESLVGELDRLLDAKDTLVQLRDNATGQVRAKVRVEGLVEGALEGYLMRAHAAMDRFAKEHLLLCATGKARQIHPRASSPTPSILSALSTSAATGSIGSSSTRLSIMTSIACSARKPRTHTCGYTTE